MYLYVYDTQTSLSAEYQLKQSKLQMSVDSSLNIKSVVDTSVGKGFAFTLAAEVCAISDIYRFGYSISLGD